MIKEFLNRLTGKTGGRRTRAALGRRVEHAQSVHAIDRALVDEHAATVVRQLKQAGHDAYIVGGAVRDLLLGLKPKDFDVATSATPEQVKSLFRRAYIVGRRFRIVHVVFGRGRDRDVVEVSTFRAHLDNQHAEVVDTGRQDSRRQLAGMTHAVGPAGRVLRDNVWGSQPEDAARRDFTINAMYYDPVQEVVIDYHGGMTDLRARRLRMIGDPAQRYREDPVRVLRAVRFAAKLATRGFRLDPGTAAPLTAAVPLLAAVPASRMFDEMIKLLQTGHAVATVEQLVQLGLAHGVYPLLDLVVERTGQPLVDAALRDTDRRVQEDKPVAPSFLLACVLWQDVQASWRDRRERGEHATPALQSAIDDVFDARIGEVSGRGKLASDMREIWLMQPRFERRQGKGPLKLVEQPRFRAGLDFMRLRAGNGEVEQEMVDWWQVFSSAEPSEREGLLEPVRSGRRTRKRTEPDAAPDVQQDLAAGGNISEGSSTRRRRRRRKPSGAAADAPPPATG